jgi:hypothetical protein
MRRNYSEEGADVSAKARWSSTGCSWTMLAIVPAPRYAACRMPAQNQVEGILDCLRESPGGQPPTRHFKKSLGHLGPGTQQLYQVTERLHHPPDCYSRAELCRTFGLSRSGFYDHALKARGLRCRQDKVLVYLAAELDLCSKRLLGWKLSTSLATSVVQEAFERARTLWNLAPQIHHSDRGVQYASSAFRQLLDSCQVSASMSRKACCYDNAAMESFWATSRRSSSTTRSL